MIKLAARSFAPVCLSLSLALPSPLLAASLVQDPSTMTDQQKIERAKQLFGEGDRAMKQEQFFEALQKFEEAYNVYAPGLHLFNFNIGMAAHGAGDCVKAKTAFQRFLDLVADHPERRTAQEKLLEIDRSGCANQQVPAATVPTPEPQPTVATPTAVDNEDAPILGSKRDERERAIEQEREQDAAKRASGLLIAGAVLTSVGILGLAGGATSLALANKKANDLAGMASPSTIGFPPGDYADDKVYDLDRNELPANNTATVVLFVAGGVLTATGVTLLVVDGVRKKKARSSAKLRGRSIELVGAGPAILPGGGGAAATVQF